MPSPLSSLRLPGPTRSIGTREPEQRQTAGWSPQPDQPPMVAASREGSHQDPHPGLPLPKLWFSPKSDKPSYSQTISQYRDVEPQMGCRRRVSWVREEAGDGHILGMGRWDCSSCLWAITTMMLQGASLRTLSGTDQSHPRRWKHTGNSTQRRFSCSQNPAKPQAGAQAAPQHGDSQ